MDLIRLYGLIDNLGALLGIVSNSLLIWIIFRVAKGKLQSYSYLVLISSIFDLFFSVIEVITQHQLLVRHGVVFVMAHGIESQLGGWAHYCCMIPHIFSCTHSVLILGPQFFYRMDLVTGASPNLYTLLKYTAVSSAASLFVGISAGVGIFQAKQRGFDYYLEQMDGPWFNEKAKRFLTYACDIRDIGTLCFYGGALVFTTICFWMSVYAIWKTFSFVRDSSSQLSDRTAALQRQFTIRNVNLIVQTINAFVFAVIPVSQICISMLLRLDLEFVGIGTMVPLSYLSVSNALLTIYIVKAYRRELCLLLPCRFAVDVHPSTTQTTKLTTNTENLSTRQTNEN
ncbi:hypothetical protein M3Y94_01074100 [Aphelenchoides besseyi]|nr:hypothetical protein M3Y94_01074100 [Aphelenchoides besseyi]KAI6218729.1 hypothetical protein M3Y95_01147000 [Aphelenchoides besseyi]